MIDWKTYSEKGLIQEIESCDIKMLNCIKTVTPIKSVSAYAEKVGYDRGTIYRWFKNERWMFDTLLLGVSIRLKAEQMDRIVALDAGLTIREQAS